MALLAYASASSGPFAGGIGWININVAQLSTGQTLTNQTATFRDGSTIKFDISNTAISGGGANIIPTAEPIFSGQAFAVAGYTGVSGTIGLYAPNIFGGKALIVTISNISVTDKNGNPVSNYYIFAADGESTNSSESLVLTTNGSPWTQVTTIGTGTTPTISGVNTQTVTLTGVNNNSAITPILYSVNPTSVSAQMAGSNQAVVFGAAISNIRLNKVINNRIYSNDQFNLNINGAVSATRQLLVVLTVHNQFQLLLLQASLAHLRLMNQWH